MKIMNASPLRSPPKMMKTTNQNPRNLLPIKISSGEFVASIDDLLIQILLCLPVKSLLRFELVSKHWLSLITDHQFSVQRTPNPTVGVFLIARGLVERSNYIPIYPGDLISNAPSINPIFTADSTRGQVVQSCNGLLLCCRSDSRDRSGFPLYDRSCWFYVYNPTTSRSDRIKDPKRSCRWVTLAYDPIKSRHYKIVLIRPTGGPQGYAYKIEVYSSETKAWRIKKEIEKEGGHLQFQKGVYWQGATHYISDRISLNSVRFDVDRLVLDEMPTPPIAIRSWDDDFNFYFGESCDHLHFIEVCRETQLKLYEMKKDYSEWFIKYQVNLSPIKAAYPTSTMCMCPELRSDYIISILSVVCGKKEEDSILILRIPCKAIKYNLVDGTFVKLCEVEDGDVEDVHRFCIESFFEDGYDYIPSLCCV